jgi:hypothetical protein
MQERTSIVAKVYTKRSLFEPDDDLTFWRGQPYQERLRAVEEIRREYHRWRYGAEPRLQSVCTIVKR